MIQRLRRLFSKAPSTPGLDRPGYLRASLGMVSGGRKDRAAYTSATALKAYSSWVYAAASINAFGVSSIPLRLYVRKPIGAEKSLFATKRVDLRRKAYLMGDGRASPSRTVLTKLHDFGSDFEEVTESHPVMDLLRKVNPYMNGFDLTATRTLWQELTGNAYLHIIPNSLGVPGELWPLPPQWVEIMPSETDFIKGYRYGKDPNSRIEIAPDRVLHFKRPNPNDLFYGMGKVEAGWGVIDLNDALLKMDTALAANHARPDYMAIVKDSSASVDALEEFERAVNEKLRGPEKAGKFIALTGEVEFKPMQMPPKDLGGRDDVVEQIAAIFGVPVSMLKANDPNLASAQTGFAQWRESTILPLLRLDEEVLNQRLLPMFGLSDSAVLAYDDPIPANRQLDLQEHQGLVASGVITINEAREARGLSRLEMPEADLPLAGGIPIGSLSAASPEDGSGSLEMPEAPEASAPAAAAQEPSSPAPAAPLNGAQIQAAQEVLLAVTAGSMSPIAGEELLVAIGLRSDAARRMVAAQREIVPAAVEPVPEATIKPSGSAPAPAPIEPRGLDPSRGEIKAVTEDAPARYAEIDFKPTSEMAAAAERGLRLRAEFNRGGTEIGVARATQLKNREVLSPSTVRRMNSYFARHAVDRAPGWDDPEDPSAGFIAWLLWGGDPGRDWAERIVGRMERADEEKASDPCISEKIPVLIDEGYDRDQAIAIAISMCEEKAQTEAKGGCGCGSHAKAARLSDLWAEPEAFEKARPGPRDLELEALERTLERSVLSISRAELKRIAKKLRESGIRPNLLVGAVLDDLRNTFERAMVKEVEPIIGEVVSLGGKRGEKFIASAMGISDSDDLPQAYRFEFTNPKVSEIIERSTTELATRSGRTMRRSVGSLLGTMVEDGASIDEMAKSLEDKGFDPIRSRTIARTETSKAMNAGRIEAWKQSGIVKGKVWQVAPDPCEFCAAIGAEAKVVDIDGAFAEKGAVLTGIEGNSLEVDLDDVAGPPLHPNCRCTMRAIIESVLDEET